MSAKGKSDYYKGGKRVVKDGVPCRVAAWYDDLTPEGKRSVMSVRIASTPYNRKYMRMTQEASQ